MPKINIMKQLSSIFLALIISANISGNNSISNDLLPAPGNYVFHKQEISKHDFDPGDEGGSVTWSFQVNPGSEQFYLKVKNASEHSASNHFPYADIVIINDFWSQYPNAMDSNFHFYGTKDNVLEKHGRVDYDENGVDLIINKFENWEVQLYRPVTFGYFSSDQWSSSFFVPSLEENIRWVNGLNSYESNAVGTLNIHGRALTNVSRLSRTRSYYVSSLSQGTYKMTKTTYEWYHPDVSFPIAALTKEVNEKEGSTKYYAYFIDEVHFGSLGIVEEKDEFVSQVYPNPTSGNLNVSYNLNVESHVQIGIIDGKGAELMILLDETQSIGNQHFTMNVNLSPGFYWLKMNVNNNISLKPVIIE